VTPRQFLTLGRRARRDDEADRALLALQRLAEAELVLPQREIEQRALEGPTAVVLTGVVVRAAPELELVEVVASLRPGTPDDRPLIGEWEGLQRDEIMARYPEHWSRWAEHPSWDIVPGGEGTDAFEGRVGAAIEGLIERHRSGRVLVVTHGGVIQVALLRVVGRSSNGLFPFTIENTSVTVLQGSPDRLVGGRVNDTCHLA